MACYRWTAGAPHAALASSDTACCPCRWPTPAQSRKSVLPNVAACFWHGFRRPGIDTIMIVFSVYISIAGDNRCGQDETFPYSGEICPWRLPYWR